MYSTEKNEMVKQSHCTEERKLVWAVSSISILTQLVNHERLNLFGLQIMSHMMQGSWQKQVQFGQLLSSDAKNLDLISHCKKLLHSG
jgi:hypothetical protein